MIGLIFQNFLLAKDPVLPKNGFAGCAVKVLEKYPGYFTSIEADGSYNGDFFYEFDVALTIMKNSFKSKVTEVEYSPLTQKLLISRKRQNQTTQDLKN